MPGVTRPHPPGGRRWRWRLPSPSKDEVLAARCGLVVAPAGCGKTHLLCDAVAGHSGRPALVLTHTHAGVAALRQRLGAKNVPSHLFRLGTLDGFALRLVRWLPERAGYNVDLGADLRPQYGRIRDAAARLLNSDVIRSLVPASYGRVLIDEYQDCTDHQHSLSLALSRHLPVCIFADELQRIFDFKSNKLPCWDTEVRPHFELVGQLDTPWRWINAGAEGLGRWLLDARRRLQAGEPIDLATAAPWVRWHQLTGDGAEDRKARIAACQELYHQGSLIVIGEGMPTGHREFARCCPGLTVVEAADLEDLTRFARRAASSASAGELLDVVLDFAAEVMTGVDRDAIKARVKALLQGTSRKNASEEERKAIAVAAGRGLEPAGELLSLLRRAAGRRVYRPTLLYAMLSSINRAAAAGSDLVAAAVVVREGLRHRGRVLPDRAIGSTLLLKGLESDNTVIIDADRMDRKYLYVALTRAAKSIIVFSREAVLNPQT